jgi:hypothetical protein
MLAALTAAFPASAGKPTATASTTIEDKGNCSFAVTYAWSGFSGSGLDAELAIGYKGDFGADVFFAWTRIADNAGGAGTVTKTFTLAGDASAHQFFARGNLFKVDKSGGLTAVRGAAAKSVYLAAQSCGTTATIS